MRNMMVRALLACGRPVPALLVALAVVSCGPARNTFPPTCPVPGLVKPLAELTRYRGASRDTRDLVVRARIIDVTGKCSPGDDSSTVATTAQIVVEATRGPAMGSDAVGLPVFIAVTEAGVVLDKTEFDLPVTFAPNIDNARAASKEVRMEIPVTARKSGAAYGIVGGFQLTPAEVAAWRRNNPRQADTAH